MDHIFTIPLALDEAIVIVSLLKVDSAVTVVELLLVFKSKGSVHSDDALFH